MRWLAALVFLPVMALAQSAGNLNLQGPSSDPNNAKIGPAALNSAINTSLMNKADAAGGVLTNPTLASPVFSNPDTARTNLGLGGMAVQDPAAVAITGGTATGLTSINGAPVYLQPYDNTAFTGGTLVLGSTAPTISTSAFLSTCVGLLACSGNFNGLYTGWLGGGGTGLTGAENTFYGANAGGLMTSGTNNTGLGVSTLGHETTASYQTAVGNDAMRNTVGHQNAVSVGANALRNSTGGGDCIAIGKGALTGNEGNASGTVPSTTVCTSNVAIGTSNMFGASAGAITNNVNVGAYSMQFVTTASHNSGLGFQNLYTCTSCQYNVAIGEKALYSLATNGQNTSVGYFSGTSSTGSNNSFFGYTAGQNNTGSGNAFFGWNAGSAATTSSNSVAIGPNAGKNQTVGANVIIGSQVGASVTSGTNNILIGTTIAVDSLAGSTSNEINIGGLLFWSNASTAVPALSACGTGSPTVDTRGNNRSGTITAGAGALASCTMTFGGSGYSTWNHCRLTSQSVVANLAYSYTLTTLTVTGTSITSAKFDYDCDGV
jgi:hypothetical protein